MGMRGCREQLRPRCLPVGPPDGRQQAVAAQVQGQQLPRGCAWLGEERPAQCTQAHGEMLSVVDNLPSPQAQRKSSRSDTRISSTVGKMLSMQLPSKMLYTQPSDYRAFQYLYADSHSSRSSSALAPTAWRSRGGGAPAPGRSLSARAVKCARAPIATSDARLHHVPNPPNLRPRGFTHHCRSLATPVCLHNPPMASDHPTIVRCR